MPDYANIRGGALPPVYRHILRAADPTTRQEVTGRLDPERRYHLRFETGRIAPEAVTQTDVQEAVQQRVAEQERLTAPPKWTEFTDIDDLPEQDYNLGRLTIKRQYSDDVKIANQFQQGSPEYTALHQEAAATMNARMTKLNVERDRVEMAFRQTGQIPILSRDEKRRMKVEFYGRNPVWKSPKVEYPDEPKPPKPMFTQGYLEKTLGDLATDTIGIYDRETFIQKAASMLGQGFAENFPEALDIMERREETNFEQPIQLRGVPEEIPELMKPEPSITSWFRGWRRRKEPTETPTPPHEFEAAPEAPPPTVRMLSPSFKVYDVPTNKVAESEKKGWKRI